MPIAREFTINLEDRPGMLGKVCQALDQQNVNILAFHSCPIEKGRSAVRLVLDNPATAKTALDASPCCDTSGRRGNQYRLWVLRSGSQKQFKHRNFRSRRCR